MLIFFAGLEKSEFGFFPANFLMTSSPRTNIYLVGFMGTGKSVLGRLLATELGYSFVDSDEQIEESAGLTIPHIFQSKGEKAFRDLERRFVESGHPGEGCVVSCGGGMILQPGILESLQKKGMVITLFASPETIYERTRGNENRPLLDVEDPLVRIRELLEERLPVYRKAGIGVLTDGRTPMEIVQHIERIYRRERPGQSPHD